MSHTCRALVMHCIDFRFGKALKQWMEEQGHLGDADIAAFAGAAKNLLIPEYEAFALRQVELSKKLHSICEVHLVNHTDCGAYGGRAAFDDATAEQQTHQRDLEAATEKIKQQHPDLTVVCWIAHIEEQEDDEPKIWMEKLA